MEAKSSGGVMGFCLARTGPQVSEEGGREDYRRTIDCILHGIRGDHHAIVGFGVPGGPLEDADPHDDGRTHALSISPSSNTHTVISVTVWVLVASSRWTLQRRMLSCNF